MGHESQIEPWLPLNQVLLAGFGTDRLRCEQAMNTADRRKPKPLGHSAWQPRSWRGRSEQISFDQVGCEARKVPALGEIFFLTSSFIELPRSWKQSRHLPARSHPFCCVIWDFRFFSGKRTRALSPHPSGFNALMPTR